MAILQYRYLEYRYIQAIAIPVHVYVHVYVLEYNIAIAAIDTYSSRYIAILQ